MKKILMALIIGATISGMLVQFRFTGDIWSNKPMEKFCPKPVEQKEYCYFQSTWGNVVREKKLDCEKYKVYEGEFKTIYWE